MEHQPPEQLKKQGLIEQGLVSSKQQLPLSACQSEKRRKQHHHKCSWCRAGAWTQREHQQGKQQEEKQECDKPKTNGSSGNVVVSLCLANLQSSAAVGLFPSMASQFHKLTFFLFLFFFVFSFLFCVFAFFSLFSHSPQWFPSPSLHFPHSCLSKGACPVQFFHQLTCFLLGPFFSTNCFSPLLFIFFTHSTQQ